MKYMVALMLCPLSLLFPAAAQLTVEEAVSRVLETHPAVEGALQVVEEEMGEALQAGLPPNPEIEGGIEGWRSGENGEWLAGISQRVPLSGSRRLARMAGMTGAAAAEREAEAQRRELKAHVETLFYEALASQERLVVAEANHEQASQMATLTRSRLDAGDIPEVDWMRASAELAHSGAGLEEARRLRGALRAQLAVLCGLPEEEFPECIGDLAPSREMLPERATIEERLRSGPHHAARELRASQADADARALRRAALPEPTVRVGMRRDRASSANALDVGVGVELPLFDRNQGAVAAARARARRIEAEREAALREELRHALGLLGDAQAALTKAAQLQNDALPQLEQVGDALEQAHELGGISLFEVFAARHATNEMRMELLDLELRARLALVELLALL